MLTAALASHAAAQQPPVVKPPSAPASGLPAAVFDAKVPTVVAIEAPQQPKAGAPFQVVVKLRVADVAGAYGSGGCTVKVQGRSFRSPGFGELPFGAGGVRERTETIEVVAAAVGATEIEVAPYSVQGTPPREAQGPRVKRAITVTSESPMRRANRSGSRAGTTLLLAEPVYLRGACSADGRAVFAVVGDAVQGHGIARYDAATAVETAYLPLAGFHLHTSVAPCITYERQGNRLFVGTGRMHRVEPYEVQVLELDADTLAVRRVVRSGVMRVAQGANHFTELSPTVSFVLSGRDGADVCLVLSVYDPANQDTMGGIAWFDMRESRCTTISLLDALAKAGGDQGLAGKRVSGTSAVIGPPLAANRVASVYGFTTLPTQKLFEATGAAVRTFDPGSPQPGGIVSKVWGLAGVADNHLYVLTDSCLVGYPLASAVPTQSDRTYSLAVTAAGQPCVSSSSPVLLHNGRVVVGSSAGVFVWNLATKARSPLDAEAAGPGTGLLTPTFLLPAGPNEVVLQVVRSQSVGANPPPPQPGKFVFYRLP